MPRRMILAIGAVLTVTLSHAAATREDPGALREDSSSALTAPAVPPGLAAAGESAASPSAVSTLAGLAPPASKAAAPPPAAAPGKPAAPAPAANLAPAASAPLEPAKGFDPKLMDLKADPCVDFYQYACGGWLEKNPVPPDRPAWGRDSELSDRNLAIVRSLLDKVSAADPARTSAEQKVGDYYASCMDEKAVETAGIAPLKAELRRISALSSKQDLAAEIGRLHSLGVGALFGFGSDQDFKDATSVIAEADQGGIGLPERDYYFRDDEKSKEQRKQYLFHVAAMFRLLGDDPNHAKANAESVLRIETALAKASLDVVSRRDPEKLYHKLPIGELAKLAPSFEWETYRKEAKVPAVKELNITVPEFFKGLEEVVRTEDLANLKTYLRWHLVHNAAPYLSSKFVNENFDFYGRKLFGSKELRPRWKRCSQYADRDLGEALGQAYVSRAFSPEAKTRTVKMVKDIEAAMAKNIESLDWMSQETKTRALEKLRAVANKIGYPDKWRDYGAVKIVRGDFFGNTQRSDAFETARQLAKIGKPVDRGEWFMTPPTVNAYYNPQMNDINFPAGILQPPYFDPAMDDAINYGDVGGVIGHELTHGFDDQGRQFDAHGNLNDWWKPADGKAFEERAACVENQFSQYKAVDDVKVNGKLTLGENVADLGGLRLAYIAFMDALGGKTPEKIDGFTAEQRFFLGYGQGWCENYTDELLRMLAQTNPHSPNSWRVNGVVSNIPEFQKAFACKAGQPMVRDKPCRVW